MSWPLVELGTVAVVSWGNTSITKESYRSFGFPAFSAAGEDGFLEIHENDCDGIVLSAIGARCGRCFKASGKWTAIKNTITILEREQGVVCLQYLFHFLSRANVWPNRGGAQPFIALGDARKVKVPFPPLSEQKRIAAILDKADAIRRKRQQAIQLADDFLRAVFLDMFGDPVTNPKGWETFTLADVVRNDSIITYGIVQAGEHVDGGVPYIRTGDFKGGKLVQSGYACTSADIASKFRRSEVAPGDIVYCIRASVGSADVVPAFLAGANLTQGTAKISPAHDMKAEFLVELLRSAGFRSWVDKNSKGATFKEITLARLREAPVFKPPVFEQEAFIRIKKIAMDRLARKFREADVPLFESISQRAFSGQL
ncbi:restriction endonuclease subunit S [Pseudomonas defluvii]|nr:restriction endonuclease subunit S [Pseudomonas defluvii]